MYPTYAGAWPPLSIHHEAAFEEAM
jgi:hypothetical protein